MSAPVFEFVARPIGTFLRLTSPVRRNGVKLFVQLVLSPDAPERVQQQTRTLLEKRLDRLVNRRPKT